MAEPDQIALVDLEEALEATTPAYRDADMPQDLTREIDQFSRGEATRAARYLAHVVGKAHARQLDQSQRDEWAAALSRQRGKGIEAPSSLWDSVVDLSAAHEGGYLEHCRRYALSQAV